MGWDVGMHWVAKSSISGVILCLQPGLFRLVLEIICGMLLDF